MPTTNVLHYQIEWMAFMEVASGFPDGSYRPHDAVKRQQTCVVSVGELIPDPDAQRVTFLLTFA